MLRMPREKMPMELKPLARKLRKMGYAARLFQLRNRLSQTILDARRSGFCTASKDVLEL